VGSATLFHCTTEVETKSLPVTVSVKAGPPTLTAFGETDTTAGAAGGETVKVVVAWPPPGAGFETMSCTFLALASSVGETAVLSCEEPTKVTFRWIPFQARVELGRKFDPLTVSVNPALPAAMELGETD
jgi:hypothetical protein